VTANDARRWARTAFLLAGAAFAAAIGYFVQLAAGGSPTSAGSRTTLEVGMGVPSSLAPLDLAFASQLRGYEILREGSRAYVATSGNGGRSWTIVEPLASSPPPLPGRNGPHFPSTAPAPGVGVSTSGAVYAYGVSSSAVAVSRDQGRTWRVSNLPGTVEDLTSDGPVLIALVDGMQPTGTRGDVVPPPATGWLYSSRDSGENWTRLTLLPAGIGPYKLLLQTSSSVLFALAPGENNPIDGVYGGLVGSSSGGRSWTVVQSPCDVDAAPRFGADAQLGATSTGTLWLVCGDSDPQDVGANLTQVETSSDGGKRWVLVAGTAEVAPYNDRNFPPASGVPPAGPASTSVFTSSSTWLVLDSPSLLLRSSDGGRTWSDGAPPVVEYEGPKFVLDVDGAIDVRTGSALWQYTDGRWRKL
jgi:hypothetical protein